MAYSEDKLEEIRARANIVEVIGAHVRLKPAGRNFVGLCPFHDEKTPSFSVNPERGFFHCFGCGAGGSVFNFIMRAEGLNFPETVESLARRYGVSLPERGGDAGPGASERAAALRANQVAADFFAHVLWKTPEGAPARNYLGARGITADTARTFMLGFAPERPANLAGVLDKRGLLAAGVRLGLVRKDQAGTRDMFRARLMFPIRDAQGRVLAFGGRVLDQRLPKYINSPESPLYSKSRNVYGLYEARAAIASADRAIIVEGYLDAIAVWQAGIKETVASLGTALTVDQLRLIGRHTRNVLACFDGDAAGRKASLRALEIFLAAGLLGRGIFIPPGYDPDTFIKERGAEAFDELARSAELLVDYFLQSLEPLARGSIDQKAEAARKIAEKVRLIVDEMPANLLIRKAVDTLRIDEQLLRAHARSKRDAVVPLPKIADVRPSAELALLMSAVRFPELRSEISSRNVIDSFEDQILADLLRKVVGAKDSKAILETEVQDLLTDRQRKLLSDRVGPLDSLPAARTVVENCIAAITALRPDRILEMTRKAVQDAANPDEAKQAAQSAIIALRRGSA
jgi:DNA primase